MPAAKPALRQNFESSFNTHRGDRQENEMQSSGVLTLVTTGYVVASFAWPRFIDRETAPASAKSMNSRQSSAKSP
eukprot:2645481-Amphidinium_carterae.1